MHPAPFVVQVEITVLQALSDVKVAGSKSQVTGIHVDVEVFQAQVYVIDPFIG